MPRVFDVVSECFQNSQSFINVNYCRIVNRYGFILNLIISDFTKKSNVRRIKCPLFSLITGCSWLGDTRQFILILKFLCPCPLRKMEGISLCCCLSVSRSVGRLIYAPWTSKNSHFFHFPFIFFSGVAPTEIKFAIQIYYLNIQVRFDFRYDQVMFDRIMPTWS